MPNGLVLLHKPVGMSSHRALGPVKRSLGTRKVGHTGTLDPFAEGLMVVLVGRATKLARWITPLGKCYQAVVQIGVETDTLDPEGTIVVEGTLVPFEKIKKAALSFLGTIQQIPPAFSAVHVDGDRSYKLARKGRLPALPPRSVTITDISVNPIDESRFGMAVCCASGTYIRSLARDIARAAGTCGYLTELRRVSVGPFFDADAVALEAVTRDSIVSMENAVSVLPSLVPATVDETLVAHVRNGGKLQDRHISGSETISVGIYSIFAPNGTLLAIAERSALSWTYHTVFNQT